MVIPVVLIISLVASSGAVSRRFSSPYSAASDSQIRFAIENKYDDTGPGAKQRETAYNTYKTLEEALISYLDDPDTKLPEYERERAIAAFQIPVQERAPIRKYPKTVEEYTGYKPIERPINPFNIPKEQPYGPPVLDLNNYEFNNIQNNYVKPIIDAFGFHKSQVVRSKPISLAHFSKDPEESYNQFNTNPSYSFSYGVHDKTTGDSKSAHETRTDDVVKGFYSFMDADGKQRTVHYTADDNLGFRAIVQRSVSNNQSNLQHQSPTLQTP